MTNIINPEEIVHRACYSKIQFASRKNAKGCKKDLERKYKKHFEIYKCPACGGFHLTRKRVREKTDLLEEAVKIKRGLV